MKQRRAFTLIELLVVIAIIAILAAILFPVFAQAKAAAKKTASLSNTKQTALGAIMYGGDVDDVISPMATFGATSGAFVYFGAPYNGYLPWTMLINPYIKNYDLFIDPQASPNTGAPAGFNVNATKAVSPNYGMNPYLVQTVSVPYPASISTPLSPRSFTAVSRPADVVLFAAKYSSSETTGNWYGSWWFTGIHFITLTIDPPDCAATGNPFVCAAGWNDNNFYGGTGGTKFLKNIEANGAWTGGASLRGAKKMIVSFLDGHAASKSPGDMAAGTAYNGAIGASGIPTQLESAIAVTDLAREHYYGIQ